VAELEGLRTVLLAAKAEQEALEKRVAEVRMWGRTRECCILWSSHAWLAM
jgi:hypothetical protein